MNRIKCILPRFIVILAEPSEPEMPLADGVVWRSHEFLKADLQLPARQQPIQSGLTMYPSSPQGHQVSTQIDPVSESFPQM